MRERRYRLLQQKHRRKGTKVYLPASVHSMGKIDIVKPGRVYSKWFTVHGQITDVMISATQVVEGTHLRIVFDSDDEDFTRKVELRPGLLKLTEDVVVSPGDYLEVQIDTPKIDPMEMQGLPQPFVYIKNFLIGYSFRAKVRKAVVEREDIQHDD